MMKAIKGSQKQRVRKITGKNEVKEEAEEN